MSRSKPNTNRPGKGAAVPYTDHLRKVVDFANSERTVRTGGVAETLSNIDIMVRKQFEAGLAGKTLAQRDYIELVQRAEQARSEHVKDQCERWTMIKEAQQSIFSRRRRPRFQSLACYRIRTTSSSTGSTVCAFQVPSTKKTGSDLIRPFACATHSLCSRRWKTV